MASSVVDWASARGIGFSHVVSLGDMADVDFGDMLDYLANDGGTRAILLYIEAVTHARKFMSAARAAARMKPVVVVKAGRHVEAARAAASHTGALAGSDAVYDAAFRRAGMLRVYELEELFDAVQTLGSDRGAARRSPGDHHQWRRRRRDGDRRADRRGRPARHAVGRDARPPRRVLPPTWSHGNPVDIVGDAPAQRYREALEAVMEDKGVDAIVVLNSPTAVASPTEAARAVVDTLAKRRQPAVFTSWIGDGAALEARRIFAEQRVPTYATPEDAVRAFIQMVAYRRNQATLMETPPSLREELAPDTASARAVVERALGEGRSWLTEPEGKEVLDAYGVPVVARATGEDARGSGGVRRRDRWLGRAQDRLAGHRAQVRDRRRRARSERAANRRGRGHGDACKGRPGAARRLDRRLQRAAHGASPGRLELIVGVTNDPQFGPMLLFGHGGTAVEVIDDQALALPPLNLRLAREVMARTRIYRQLEGYRGRPAANLDAIASTLIKISQLVIDLAEIDELDVNPLLADEYGVVALDARIKVAPASGPATLRLAIRPYPKELEEAVPLGDGRELILRPVLPEDEPAFQNAFAKLTPEEIRLRFFTPLKTLSHVMAARFTQIDYDREMALVLAAPGIPGKSEIYGVAQITADPDNERAEYAIVVRHDMTGMGLGVLLMRRLIDYARQRGTKEMFGDVLRENTTMLRMCEVLGFARSSVPDEPGLMRVTLDLSTAKARSG